MGRILGEILGRLQTLHLWDGNDFRNLKCNTDGHALIDNVHLVERYEEPFFYCDGMTASTSGNITMEYDPLNPGETGVVCNMLAYDISSNIGAIVLAVYYNGTGYLIQRLFPANASVACVWTGSIVIPYGAKLQAGFIGAYAGDVLNFHCVGYKRGV